MIEVRHLTKRYGDTLAVDDLNFTIEKGRIYGFLGPNGAGKSTTMNIITGYLASTDGSVTINGHDILEDAEAAKKNIGYLPELPPLYFDMTVKEYLAFAAELKKIPKAERKNQITRVCATTKLDAVQNRLIKNLSKGYRQRVGLAQALLGSPEILILDEPTVGLDPKQILEIRDLIKELGKEHTVILSSHILSEISAVCDYVLILSHGKLVASDTLENLTSLMQGQNSLIVTVKSSKEQLKEILLPNLSKDNSCDHTGDHTAVNRKTATTGIKYLRQIILIVIPTKYNIIYSRTNHSKYNIPQRKIQIKIRLLPGALCLKCCHQISHHHTKCNDHSIKCNRETTNGNAFPQ